MSLRHYVVSRGTSQSHAISLKVSCVVLMPTAQPAQDEALPQEALGMPARRTIMENPLLSRRGPSSNRNTECASFAGFQRSLSGAACPPWPCSLAKPPHTPLWHNMGFFVRRRGRLELADRPIATAVSMYTVNYILNILGAHHACF